MRPAVAEHDETNVGSVLRKILRLDPDGVRDGKSDHAKILLTCFLTSAAEGTGGLRVSAARACGVSARASVRCPCCRAASGWLTHLGVDVRLDGPVAIAMLERVLERAEDRHRNQIQNPARKGKLHGGIARAGLSLDHQLPAEASMKIRQARFCATASGPLSTRNSGGGQQQPKRQWCRCAGQEI